MTIKRTRMVHIKNAMVSIGISSPGYYKLHECYKEGSVLGKTPHYFLETVKGRSAHVTDINFARQLIKDTDNELV